MGVITMQSNEPKCNLNLRFHYNKKKKILHANVKTQCPWDVELQKEQIVLQCNEQCSWGNGNIVILAPRILTFCNSAWVMEAAKRMIGGPEI